MVVNKFVVAVLCFLMMSSAWSEEISGDYYKKVIFEDDFSGEKLEKPWRSYKSASKIENGVLVGITPPTADHPSVNFVPLKTAFSDVEVSLKFKFKGSPFFNINFDDSKYKGAHAGHICSVGFNLKGMRFKDGKNGVFRNDIRAMKVAKKLDEKTKEYLKTMETTIPFKFSPGKWYNLNVRIKGELMQVFIDGKLTGQFSSPGMAHPTKNKPSFLVVKKAMHIDNVVVKVP